MPHSNISTSNYVAVIADLRAKRDELDRVITMLEAMAQLSQPVAAVALGSPVTPANEIQGGFTPASDTTSPHQTGIGERCMAILRDHGQGRPMSTRQVTDTLLASGFPLTTKNPSNNVWSALSHRAKVSRDVARVRKDWRYVGASKKEASPQNATSSVINGALFATRPQQE